MAENPTERTHTWFATFSTRMYFLWCLSFGLASTLLSVVKYSMKSGYSRSLILSLLLSLSSFSLFRIKNSLENNLCNHLRHTSKVQRTNASAPQSSGNGSFMVSSNQLWYSLSPSWLSTGLLLGLENQQTFGLKEHLLMELSSSSATSQSFMALTLTLSVQSLWYLHQLAHSLESSTYLAPSASQL